MTGLRERKKQRTHGALIRAAIELFVTQGYDTTTIDEISEAVDVSQRTFFRYFGSKEEVALAPQSAVDRAYLDAVIARPPEEFPAQALRNALDATWPEMGETVGEIVSLNLYMRMWQVIETTPALLAAQLRASFTTEERLAAALARREGVDLDEDLRPRALAAAFSGVLRAAGRHWGSGSDSSLAAAHGLTARYVDQLFPALQGSWSERGAARLPGPHAG
ncbi:TetR family transcriptional regulator [Streptomyces sp. AJS327]|uniref:TetR family transcriptional regulator n=1 Tax=Streptomyces sp. AJS327 TaxID=2545265 RepID=UPI0015DF577B|nr:TetR family transcriptional regulator [Streptomyces sp. AJS327]MBA0049998.1 TetR family transcriptional regulator [Streptomyces sp. AJS327]